MERMENCEVCRRKSYLVVKCKCHSHYCINHKDSHICTFDVIVNGRAKIKQLDKLLKVGYS